MAYFDISPVVATPAVQELGGLVLIVAEFRNILTGVLAAPGTSISIQINGPTGAVVQAYAAMTADTTVGRYYYVFSSSTSTMFPGRYSVKCKCVDSGTTSGPVVKPSLFILGSAA